ncbi:MAG: family 2 glycosyl [Planctomycetota bacterium]|nr:MAG: family 2 glycosyl [Planctomycetota bacterium]
MDPSHDALKVDARPEGAAKEESAPEVSVVIPCLNESETVGTCVRKALDAMKAAGIAGEVIVADNGSADGAERVAREAGARVVDAPLKGYGNALMFGIAASRGRFIVMGDADDSYDFGDTPKFVERLRGGDELVMGCRLPSGGGSIEPGAMKPLHRWFGNPGLSFLVRWMFGAPIHDVYCGMRGFSRDLYDRLAMRCTGMEFAIEMIVKASLFKRRIGEVPITLHRDGRTKHRGHLRSFRDGWRSLRFYLLYSPKWLFMAPGIALFALGMLGYALAIPGVKIGAAKLDVHTLLVASLLLLLGQQAFHFAITARTFAVTEGLLPPSPALDRFLSAINLERGIVIGLAVAAVGVGLIAWASNEWRQAGFGALDYGRTMRLVIPGVTLAAMGVQSVLASFIVSLLQMARRRG